MDSYEQNHSTCKQADYIHTSVKKPLLLCYEDANGEETGANKPSYRSLGKVRH